MYLKPAYDKNCVPVVFAASNSFVPYFAVCFQSMIENTSSCNNYDVILIESNVSEDNKKILSAMVEDYQNITLRFYNAQELVKNYNLKANEHITTETYYRFLIQQVIPDYKKVLYLDSDMIINSDVAQLYNTDVDGYMVAAVRDAEFLGNINGASKTIKAYATEVLKMKNPYNYFQAGVLLFNETEMRKAYSLDQWLAFASTPYKYNDQDVLNIYCEGRVKYIDMEWNLITDCNHTRVSEVIVHAPEDIKTEYARATANPKIIHSAGHIKPWHNPQEDKAEYFWKYAEKTAYYNELLLKMNQYLHKNRLKIYLKNCILNNKMLKLFYSTAKKTVLKRK